MGDTRACPFCGSDDVERRADGRSARCRRCAGVFDPAGKTTSNFPELPALVPTKVKRGLPPSYEVWEAPDAADYRTAAGAGLRVRFRTRENELFDSWVVVGVVAAALASLRATWTGAPAALAVAAAVVACAALYWLFGFFLERTELVIERGKLRVKRRPLRRTIEVPTANIVQFFCKDYRPGYAYARQKADVKRFSLAAKLASGEVVTLYEGFRSIDHAIALEQVLERALLLRDAPVVGESVEGYELRPEADDSMERDRVRIAVPSASPSDEARSEAEAEADAEVEADAASAREASR